MEAGANAWDGSAVVVDHRESKADGEQEAGEIVEVEKVFASGGRQCGFHAVPDYQDRREGTEEVLAHRVEEAEVPRQQVVDGLKDEL